MIRIEFSEEEKQALDYERYHHPHPHVQRKMEALWLKSQKLPHKDICRFTGISKHTLCTYLEAYKEGSIKNLAPCGRTILVHDVPDAPPIRTGHDGQRSRDERLGLTSAVLPA